MTLALCLLCDSVLSLQSTKNPYLNESNFRHEGYLLVLMVIMVWQNRFDLSGEALSFIYLYIKEIKSHDDAVIGILLDMTKKECHKSFFFFSLAPVYCQNQQQKSFLFWVASKKQLFVLVFI